MEWKIDPQVTYALALEGGAALDGYTLGVWKALRELEVRVTAAALPLRGILTGDSPEALEPLLLRALESDAEARETAGLIRDSQPLQLLLENGYKYIVLLRAPGFSVERPVRIPRGVEVFTIVPKGELAPGKAVDNARRGYLDAVELFRGGAEEQRGGEDTVRSLYSATLRVTARRQPESRREGNRGTEPLRVCLMNDSFPPLVDGVANAVVNYAHILTETEGGCVVATPDYPDVKDDYPFPVVRYPSLDTTKMVGYRAGNPFDFAAVEKLSDMDFDLIHSHCPVASTILARVLRENVQKPVVFTYHTKFDIDIENAIRLHRVQERAIRLLVNNISACDEVWVVSRGAGENLRSLGYEGDYIVMPNGVDLTRGEAPATAVAALSEKWDLQGEAPVYLFLGRMMWYKGLRLILDGLRQVRAAGQDFRMVFVGDGQDKAEVEAYAKELGLWDVCRFVGAERDREVIRAWYTRCDLLLFPSTFDTNGLVVREAAACSLGTLLIEGSCAAEDIIDGDTGILIPETAEGLAAALLAPDAGREKFRRIGKNASEKIYLSWSDSVAHAREQYRSMLERWHSGELRRKRTKFDGFFDLTGDVNEILEHTKNVLDDVLDKYF